MSDPAVLRIVLVGAGRIAAEHVRAIDALPGVRLVAVVDPDEGAARAFAEGRDAIAAPDLPSALAEADAEAAIVAAPTALHTLLAAQALDAGLHVLVEKPIAPSPAELDALIAQAARAGRVLVSGQVVRFLPTVVAARELVATGRVGPVEQVVQRRVELRESPAAWWSDAEDFLLHHWGSHSIDLVLDLLGERAPRVLCRGGSGVPGFAGLDSVNLLADLSGGGRLSVNLSFSSRAPRHDLLVIGRRGTLELSGYGTLSLNGETVVDRPEAEVLAEGFRAQLTDFAAAVRGGTPARAAAETVRGALAVLEAASRSLRSGAVERVPEPGGRR